MSPVTFGWRAQRTGVDFFRNVLINEVLVTHVTTGVASEASRLGLYYEMLRSAVEADQDR